MKKQIFKMAVGILISAALFTSCKKDKVEEEANENEVITTMKLTFAPTDGSAIVTYQFDDADGPGGRAKSTGIRMWWRWRSVLGSSDGPAPNCRNSRCRPARDR